VVSHHLDGSHHTRLAAILQPAADHGVHRVSRGRPAGHLPKQSRRNRRVPHDAVRTLRRIPLASSRTASPQPLPTLPFATHARITEMFRTHRRPEWAPIHRNGSPHIRPFDTEASNKTVKRSQQPWHLSPDTGPLRRVGFEAFLHRRVRNIVLPLPAERCPILPWALFPFKVHSDALNTRRANLRNDIAAETVRGHQEAPVRPGNTANRIPDQHAWGTGLMAIAETTVNGARCGKPRRAAYAGLSPRRSRIGRTIERWWTGNRFGRIPS